MPNMNAFSYLEKHCIFKNDFTEYIHVPESYFAYLCQETPSYGRSHRAEYKTFFFFFFN